MKTGSGGGAVVVTVVVTNSVVVSIWAITSLAVSTILSPSSVLSLRSFRLSTFTGSGGGTILIGSVLLKGASSATFCMSSEIVAFSVFTGTIMVSFGSLSSNVLISSTGVSGKISL